MPEELKPCPICGEQPFETHKEGTMLPTGLFMCCESSPDSPETWNNAWAHKEIERLKAENEKLKRALEDDTYPGDVYSYL